MAGKGQGGGKGLAKGHGVVTKVGQQQGVVKGKGKRVVKSLPYSQTPVKIKLDMSIKTMGKVLIKNPSSTSVVRIMRDDRPQNSG